MSDFNNLEGKQCNKCGEFKPFTLFCRHKKSKDGFNWTCKECAASLHRKWREEHRGYKPPCLANYEGYHQRWYQENKQRHLEKQREQRKDRAPEIREYMRGYRERNREKIKEWQDRWEQEHPGDAQRRTERWQAKNPDRVLEINKRRRARKLGAEGSHTMAEFAALCQQYNNKCLRCGETKRLTADHVVPLSKGGTDYIENIQPLCIACNSSKHTQTIDYR